MKAEIALWSNCGLLYRCPTDTISYGEQWALVINVLWCFCSSQGCTKISFG